MLNIKNLTKTFNKGTENEIEIFNDFSLSIEENKCTTLIGSNGCGKSTLLNIIAGSLPIDAGEIILDNINIENLAEEKRAKYIARVFQDPSMGVSPSLTIKENLALACNKNKSFTLKKLIKRNETEQFVDMLLDLNLGLQNKLDTKVKFLSGGQRQSLSLVMATIIKPKLLLLDEHTAALDPKTSSLIMEKTRQLINKEKITTIMISHNMKDAIEYSDNVIMLDTGKIVFQEKSKNLCEKDLFEIYNI